MNYHLKKVFDEDELEADSVIRKFRITAADGKTYDTQHYSLQAILAVGYKRNSERTVQFRVKQHFKVYHPSAVESVPPLSGEMPLQADSGRTFKRQPIALADRGVLMILVRAVGDSIY